MREEQEEQWLNISDLPEMEQEPFSRWLRGEIYLPYMYEMWKAHPDKVARECGKGWYPLIDAAEKELVALGVEDKHWTIIKEKFGGLRLHFNTDHLTTDTAKLARQVAEKFIKAASSICECCGSDQGEMHERGGILKTICQKCNIKHDFRHGN